MNTIISSLRLTSAHFQNFQSLVIIQQNSLRTADNLSSTILGNDIYSIASPNVNRNNTLILSIESNGTRLRVGSATRNISLCFQVCQSSSSISSREAEVYIRIIRSALSNRLFNSLFIQSQVISQSIVITREPQITLLFSQFTLNNNLSSGVGQIHSRATHSINLTGQAVHHIATFAFGNSNCVMHQLAIIVNNCVFGARIINHLVITSNEHLFANRMVSAIFVLIFSNNLYIQTRNGRQFHCSENITTLGASYESFSRLREHHFGAVDITLITIFILQNTIFQTFQSNSLAYITLARITIARNNFNTSRRNIERNLSTLNDQNLTIYILFSLFNLIAFSIQHFTLRLTCGSGFINTSQQILVSSQSMTSNNLCHLARIQREGDRAADINLSTNLNIVRQVICSTRSGMRIVLSRILQNHIPVFGSSGKQLSSFIIISCGFKSLGVFIKDDHFIRSRKGSLSRANPATYITLSSVKNISVFINRKD